MDRGPSSSRAVAVGAIAALSALVCGLGLLVMITGFAPSRATRFGVAAALEGPDALRFGSSIFLLGLMPLLALATSARTAAWLGSCLAALLLANVFFGARLWG